MEIIQYLLSGSQAIYLVDLQKKICVSADMTGEEQIAAVENEIKRQEEQKIADDIAEIKRQKNWSDAALVLESKIAEVAKATEGKVGG